jgi:putative glutamine amidotransferase
MRPVIGITGRPQDVPAAGTTLRAYLTTHTYSDSVRTGGGLPVLLIPVAADEIDDVLDRIDGVMFTGGGDIDPRNYGEDEEESIFGVDAERDAFELALVHRVMERQMPTMAICRGVQVINVGLGGTLVQDLPSHRGAHGHDIVGEDAYTPHSQALIDPNCRISTIIGDGMHDINSIHHQAIEDLADGLKVVGSAPDGTIEAIEHEDANWPLIAVQWHPEFLGVRDHGPSHDLFEAFVEAAAKYRAGT